MRECVWGSEQGGSAAAIYVSVVHSAEREPWSFNEIILPQ